MLKNAIIIALVVYLIYLYYQQKHTRPSFITGSSSENQELIQVKQTNQTLTSFLRDQLNSNSLERTKN